MLVYSDDSNQVWLKRQVGCNDLPVDPLEIPEKLFDELDRIVDSGLDKKDCKEWADRLYCELNLEDGNKFKTIVLTFSNAVMTLTVDYSETP